MLDDEEHLVVVRGRRQGTLLRQQLREAQVAGIAKPVHEVGHNPRFERSLVLVHLVLAPVQPVGKKMPGKLQHNRQAREATSLRKTFQPAASIERLSMPNNNL